MSPVVGLGRTREILGFSGGDVSWHGEKARRAKSSSRSGWRIPTGSSSKPEARFAHDPLRHIRAAQ